MVGDIIGFNTDCLEISLFLIKSLLGQSEFGSRDSQEDNPQSPYAYKVKEVAQRLEPFPERQLSIC